MDVRIYLQLKDYSEPVPTYVGDFFAWYGFYLNATIYEGTSEVGDWTTVPASNPSYPPLARRSCNPGATYSDLTVPSEATLLLSRHGWAGSPRPKSAR